MVLNHLNSLSDKAAVDRSFFKPSAAVLELLIQDLSKATCLKRLAQLFSGKITFVSSSISA